jgi:hypothetical protein
MGAAAATIGYYSRPGHCDHKASARAVLESQREGDRPNHVIRRR